MDRDQKENLIKIAGDGLSFGRPMSKHTTFRVGGPAEAMYMASDLNTLRNVIRYLIERDIPYVVIGNGSNLLVKDGGLEGVAIFLCGALASCEKSCTEEFTLMAGAGLGLDGLLNCCRRSGLGGLEFLAGIPGSVGGATVMNSGAYGSEIQSRVRDVHLIIPPGNLAVRKRSELKFSYRALFVEQGSVIVQVSFKLEEEKEEDISKNIMEFLVRRKKRQPLQYPSAGSVFKNPPGDYAGRLLDSVGLKGEKIGGAMISEKHSNFIVNTGGATAQDILKLISLARDKVKKETGVELEPEIRVMGR